MERKESRVALGFHNWVIYDAVNWIRNTGFEGRIVILFLNALLLEVCRLGMWLWSGVVA